jgi:hypothetical protein
MKKRNRSARRIARKNVPISWLPIDSRFFPFFSFSHVSGTARVFIILEMILSVTMVTSALLLTVFRYIVR